MTNREPILVSQSLIDEFVRTINQQNAEIERLTEENKKVSAYMGNGWGYVSFLEFVKNQRAEAIKEFAERLKKELSLYRKECRNLLDNGGVFAMDKARQKVDNLVKEMVGDVG